MCQSSLCVYLQRQVNFSFCKTSHPGSPQFLHVAEGHCKKSRISAVQLKNTIMKKATCKITCFFFLILTHREKGQMTSFSKNSNGRVLK